MDDDRLLYDTKAVRLSEWNETDKQVFLDDAWEDFLIKEQEKLFI